MLQESYLMELVKQYAATPQGKKQIKNVYGIDYDPNKDRGISQADILAYAERMRMILWQHINKHIKSVSLDDILVETPIEDSTGITLVSLSFRPGSMFRASLAPRKYPDGVPNIVLHFTRGWSARGGLRGEWHGEKVWSRRSRSGSSFMQDAVAEFNAVAKGVATAEISSAYK